MLVSVFDEKASDAESDGAFEKEEIERPETEMQRRKTQTRVLRKQCGGLLRCHLRGKIVHVYIHIHIHIHIHIYIYIYIMYQLQDSFFLPLPLP